MTDATNSRLYDTDFYAWTQDQAARLRALAGDNRFDVAHIAEEIADLGKSQQNAIASHVRLAVQHLCQIVAAPANDARNHWAGEVDAHRAEIRQLLETSPSLANKLDLATLWSRAVKDANRKLARFGDPTLPADLACPLRLGDLIDDAVEVEDLVGVVRPAVDLDDGNGRATQ